VAPSDTRDIATEKLKHRATWDAHGLDGWYIGLPPEHYQCNKVKMPNTHAVWVEAMVEFFPTKVTKQHSVTWTHYPHKKLPMQSFTQHLLFHLPPFSKARSKYHGRDEESQQPRPLRDQTIIFSSRDSTPRCDF
jgi:hypothetical protein